MDRRYDNAAAAVVAAVWVTIWLIGSALDPPQEPRDYSAWLISLAIVGTPSVLASRLLWRAWWNRTGVRLAALDGPARLLAVATAALPADRRDWGTAMAAELEQLEDRRTRWRFATGCARTALLPPGSSRDAVLLVGSGALAAVVLTGITAGDGIRLFAVTFVALVGAGTTLVVARSVRTPRATGGPVVAVAGVAGVVACLAVTGYFLDRYPSAADELRPASALVLATVLAAVAGLALVPPRALASSRLARRTGVIAGLAVAAGLLLDSRGDGEHSGVIDYVMLVPTATYFLAALVVAMLERSFRAGVQTTVWAVVVATLGVFALWLVEGIRWHDNGGDLLLDGDGGPVEANLADAVFWILLLAPAWSVPFGVFGAAAGHAMRRRSRPAAAPRAAANH